MQNTLVSHPILMSNANFSVHFHIVSTCLSFFKPLKKYKNKLKYNI